MQFLQKSANMCNTVYFKADSVVILKNAHYNLIVKSVPIQPKTSLSKFGGMEYEVWGSSEPSEPSNVSPSRLRTSEPIRLALARAEYVTGWAEWSRIQCEFASFSILAGRKRVCVYGVRYTAFCHMFVKKLQMLAVSAVY